MSPDRTIITNVRVFDGRGLTGPRTVVVDGATIGTGDTGARIVDGAGGTLLPGLIDTHVHLDSAGSLALLRDHGVTTALDMGLLPAARLAAMRDRPGLPDVRRAGMMAIGPGGGHARMPGLPPGSIPRDPDQARAFVADRVADGAHHIKIVAEPPGAGGPDQATMNALVAAAHGHGLRTVTHAARAGAYLMALESGSDVITHVPLDRPLSDAEAARMAAGGRIASPTLVMMAGIAGRTDPGAASVAALHRAGVPILAGSDANASPGVPFSPRHGASLHQELALLVDAGLSTAEALRAATALPARHLGLPDRGTIEPGRRADLLLVDGDPLADITATRHVVAVWCAGVEHRP